jgi:hypothetical protein
VVHSVSEEHVASIFMVVVSPVGDVSHLCGRKAASGNWGEGKIEKRKSGKKKATERP